MKTRTQCDSRSRITAQKLLILRAGSILLLLLCLALAPAAAQTYSTIFNFGGLEGQLPQTKLVSGPDGWVYGSTSGKVVPPGWRATLFKFHVSNPYHTYVRLKSFVSTNEGITFGHVALSEATVYCVASAGGVSNLGTVFKVNTDGTGFAVIKQFTNAPAEGANPWGGMVCSGATLYGTTVNGGSNDYGVVFSIGVNGEDYTVLKHFTYDASHPQGSLVLSGPTLYGTAAGALFKLNTNGSGYTVIHQGPGSSAGLVLSGTNLYGTHDGASYGYPGAVFKINTDGSGYTVLKELNWIDAARPNPDLVLAGDVLFGTTQAGGPGPYFGGTVFMLTTNGGGFAVIHNFGLSEFAGSAPHGGPALVGRTLFGTTYRGGHSDSGVLFQLVMPVPPTIQQPPVTQTAEAGSSVRFSVVAGGDPDLAYQWQFNQTNLDCHAASLDLTNVQPAHGGEYSVLVTNRFWPAARAPAFLNVIPPVEHRLVPGVLATGEPGGLLNLDCTDALDAPAPWLPVGTVIMAGTSQWCFDTSAPLPPERFYRAWQTGTPGVIPSLSLHWIPALTLTGNIGSQLRADGINQFGPTDVWFTVDTVTLTNTSQFYFDVLAVGQPPRLYRLVPMP